MLGTHSKMMKFNPDLNKSFTNSKLGKSNISAPFLTNAKIRSSFEKKIMAKKSSERKTNKVKFDKIYTFCFKEFI